MLHRITTVMCTIRTRVIRAIAVCRAGIAGAFGVHLVTLWWRWVEFRLVQGQRKEVKIHREAESEENLSVAAVQQLLQ